MLHRIREAMGAPSFQAKMEGHVEIDETFVGGKSQNRRGNSGNRRGAGTKRAPKVAKAIVFGMIERGGQVRAMTIPDVKSATLVPKVREHVRGGSTVYTDAALGYVPVAWTYNHRVIDHAIEYVNGTVHTNHIENFWSCLKRTLGGTYIAARPFHLDAYLGEQVFRFNERGDNDGGRFVKALKGADRRRPTYAALTASHSRWRLRVPKQ
jgi:transposase-like protein